MLSLNGHRKKAVTFLSSIMKMVSRCFVLWYNEHMKNKANKTKTITKQTIKRILACLLALTLAFSLLACQQKEERTFPLRIAVIDTGFSTNAILEGNILEGHNYVDAEASTEDTFGHGTAVASIILANYPEAKLVPLVSSTYEDGHLTQVTEEVLAQMIRDAVDVYDCSLINVSAGLQSASSELEEAVEYAWEKGVLIVASAGNDYAEQGEIKYYPAAYEHVFAVGALNADGTQLAEFSQRGDWVNGYEIGENVRFAALSGAEMTGDGTSYAAAKATAEAAKLWEEHPRESVGELFRRLEEQISSQK